MKNLKIAIVGASGLVGQKILEVLFEQGIYQNSIITLFVSKKSAGKVLYFKGLSHRLVEIDETNAEKKFDIVFFSAGEDVSKKYAETFAKNGAFVIDNTNAFRKTKPLIIPEINIKEIGGERIISNPNCSSTQLALVLNKFNSVCEISEIVVSTYQSVSGAGKEALLDLENSTNSYFEKGIKNNVIAKIGEIDENGNSLEENKIMFEVNKILKTNIKIIATAVRVPVNYCHGESVYIKLKNSVDFEKLKQTIRGDNLMLCDDVCLNREIYNTDLTAVCRLRKISDTEVACFVMADNLRRGAAYNAVMIAKYIVENLIKMTFK